MGLKSSKSSINLSMIRFYMHDRSSGCGQRYPNFLLIRTVPNFPLAKGVRIIEVGLYIEYMYKVPEYSSKEPHLPAPLGALPHKPQHRSTMKLTLYMVQRTSSKHKKTSWEKKTLAKVVAIYVSMQYTAHVDVLLTLHTM